MKVIKRNGTEVDFDIEKITGAVTKAMESWSEQEMPRVTFFSSGTPA